MLYWSYFLDATFLSRFRIHKKIHQENFYKQSFLGTGYFHIHWYQRKRCSPIYTRFHSHIWNFQQCSNKCWFFLYNNSTCTHPHRRSLIYLRFRWIRENICIGRYFQGFHIFLRFHRDFLLKPCSNLVVQYLSIVFCIHYWMGRDKGYTNCPRLIVRRHQLSNNNNRFRRVELKVYCSDCTGNHWDLYFVRIWIRQSHLEIKKNKENKNEKCDIYWLI